MIINSKVYGGPCSCGHDLGGCQKDSHRRGSRDGAGRHQCDRQSPLYLVRSGFGDMIGKYIALADWRMAHALTGEFYCDREPVEAKVTALREKHGFTEFAGDNVEYHPSGCLTFPVLGTKARQEDKLAFDPDRKKRRAFYNEVVEAFSDYSVFVGGSSSFDMAPKPYNKYHAPDLYCKEHGLEHENVVFVGDDYGLGGNDESVYVSDFPFVCVDDYRDFPKLMQELL